MEEESFRNHCGIMEKESLGRNHGGEIMEEESWRRNHGRGIMEEESSGEASRASGGIWEASGNWGGPGRPEAALDGKCSKTILFYDIL
jgi:hypothetical protein